MISRSSYIAFIDSTSFCQLVYFKSTKRFKFIATTHIKKQDAESNLTSKEYVVNVIDPKHSISVVHRGLAFPDLRTIPVYKNSGRVHCLVRSSTVITKSKSNFKETH